MIDYFISLPPVIQALLGGCFTWSFTALGAAVVFLTRRFNQRLLDGMLGLAGGVMVAASFWSLLVPALEMAGETQVVPWLPVASGFAAGWIFLMLLDRIIPHLHIGFPVEEAEGMKSSFHRTTLLVLAITMHNIPEGLAIGVAFGAVALAIPQATIAGALALSLGIAIQNFPEGLAVSMPLRREGVSRLRCFWYGQLSAVVEPVMAMIGAAVVILARPALPVALAFAAGAMIFVVVEEVIPESLKNGFEETATSGFLAGFLIMMILDVALG
ncbi:MAG: dihydroorotate dehydrogenase [Methanolinea sp. SDB]|nr:MAG: dihydroorotate dehydrogenase [Methanolinea sp. SDB]